MSYIQVAKKLIRQLYYRRCLKSEDRETRVKMRLNKRNLKAALKKANEGLEITH